MWNFYLIEQNSIQIIVLIFYRLQNKNQFQTLVVEFDNLLCIFCMILSSAHGSFSAKEIITHYEEDYVLPGSTPLRFDEESNLFLSVVPI